MPTLQFKGKTTIWNHHLAVPYYTLDTIEKLDYDPHNISSGNLIIEGDNLLALKALLPQYGGRIKCIYIDPPYNTGAENWVYNDNVNHPMFKTWLGQTVGKDDLTRHDKWLCMMTPRLKLLHELLSEDGAIFVSIDYNEEANLRNLLDEIFGEENYRNTFVASRIKKNIKENDQVKSVNFGYNSVIFYARSEKTLIEPPYKFQKKDERWHAFDAPGIRNTMKYELFGLKPPRNRHWMFSEEKAKELIEKGFLRANPSTGKPQYKLEASDETLVDTNWTDIQEAGFFCNFPNGEKNIDLIKRIIGMASRKNDIILDSFAGSGTTMHAVMDLNKEDGGRRACIMVQMTEAAKAEPKKNICRDITRERIKRAIDKYQYKDGFRYLKVGVAIDAETMLSGSLPTWKQFAEYVYYLCTGTYLKDKKEMNEKSWYAGEFGRTVIYLVYKNECEYLSKMAVTLDLAKPMIAANPGKRIVVYAPACFLEESFMRGNNIEFVGIPYDLFKRTEVQ